MAKRITREVVTFEITASDFPQIKGVLGKQGSGEVSEHDYEALKDFAEEGILAVVLSDSCQYGRNGGAYIACNCADTTGGRRKRAPDSVERILARCRELERRVNLATSTFDMEARLLVELAQENRLGEAKNYHFEMKSITPGMGGGEVRTISANSRKQAERLYWAWSSFKSRRNPDGTYDGYCGKYRLAVAEC